jgi:hypothetical protein
MISSADRFLAGKAQTRRARLIFALDATASRQPTWDMAVVLQRDMFREAENIGQLDVQLAYYRGLAGFDGECRSSRWMLPSGLTAAMQKIHCRAGETQIARILQHVINENQILAVNAVIFVGDAMEENPDTLVAKAAIMHVPAFMFQEGRDPVVETVFKQIAVASKGAYARFDSSASRQLADLLKAVLAFVTGGFTALAARKDETSVKLLSQLKK